MKKRYFTIVELLIVIAIIVILAGIAIPALSGVRERSKRASCMSNLKQLSIAVAAYQDKYRRYPAWLSNLQPKQKGIEDAMVCPADPQNEVRSCNRSKRWDDYNNMKTSFDAPGTTTVSGYSRPTDISKNGREVSISYSYEFCGGEYPWDEDSYDGVTMQKDESDSSWQSVKLGLLKKCRRAGKSIDSRMPMIRCWWHVKGSGEDKLSPALNVSSTGNVYTSRSSWANGVDI